MKQFYVRPWDDCIANMRIKNWRRLASMSNERWEKLSLQWDPNEVPDYSQDYTAYRRAGRLLLRWTDY